MSDFYSDYRASLDDALTPLKILTQLRLRDREHERDRREHLEDVQNEQNFVTGRDATRFSQEEQMEQMRESATERQARLGEDLREQSEEKRERMKSRLALEQLAQRYHVTTIDDGGNPRSEADITADIDKQAGQSASKIKKQLDDYQKQIDGIFSSNTNLAAIQQQASRNISNDTSLLSQLKPETAAQLKGAIANPNGLSTLVYRMTHGMHMPFSHSEEEGNLIKSAFDKEVDRLTTVFRDTEARNAQIKGKAILDRMTPLASEYAKHFAAMSAPAQTGLLSGDPNAQDGDKTKALLDAMREQTAPSAPAAAPTTNQPPTNSAFDPSLFANRIAERERGQQVAALQNELDQLQQHKKALLDKVNSRGAITQEFDPAEPSASRQSLFVPYTDEQKHQWSVQGQQIEAQIQHLQDVLRYAHGANLYPQRGADFQPQPLMRAQPGFTDQHFDTLRQKTGLDDVSLPSEPEINKMEELAKADGMSDSDIQDTITAIQQGDTDALKLFYTYRDRARASLNGNAFQTATATPQQ